jgi:hypothetical protein
MISIDKLAKKIPLEKIVSVAHGDKFSAIIADEIVDLKLHLRNFVCSETFADCRIRLNDGKVFPAHRIILA